MYGNALPVIVILVKCHGCRLIQRRDDPRFPCGGMDVINTPAGAVVHLQILLHDEDRPWSDR